MAGLHGGVWPQPHPPEPGASNVQSADLQAAAAATPMAESVRRGVNGGVVLSLRGGDQAAPGSSGSASPGEAVAVTRSSITARSKVRSHTDTAP